MRLSRWLVSAQGNMIGPQTISGNRRLNIVYLDDHRLFSDAVIDYCIQPYFPIDKLEVLRNGYDAYRYIRNRIDQNSRVDLFLTDINHPGMRGDELIPRIRQYETEKKTGYRIPIVVITMMDYAFVPGLVGTGIGMVDCYFSKTSDTHDIVEGIEALLY